MAMTNAEFAADYADLLAAHLTLTDPAGFETDLTALLNDWLQGAITVAELARKLTETLGYWNQNQLEFKDWWSGTPTGGPNNDGTYPMTNGVGATVQFPSVAKLAKVMQRGQDAAIDIHGYFQGLPSPSAVLGRYIHAGEDATYDPALSKANARVAPTGDKVITISLDGASWATVTFLAGENDGVIAITGGDLAAGEILEFVAPSVQDGTFADIAIHLAGVINYT